MKKVLSLLVVVCIFVSVVVPALASETSENDIVNDYPSGYDDFYFTYQSGDLLGFPHGTFNFSVEVNLSGCSYAWFESDDGVTWNRLFEFDSNSISFSVSQSFFVQVFICCVVLSPDGRVIKSDNFCLIDYESLDASLIGMYYDTSGVIWAIMLGGRFLFPVCVDSDNNFSLLYDMGLIQIGPYLYYNLPSGCFVTGSYSVPVSKMNGYFDGNFSGEYVLMEFDDYGRLIDPIYEPEGWESEWSTTWPFPTPDVDVTGPGVTDDPSDAVVDPTSDPNEAFGILVVLFSGLSSLFADMLTKSRFTEFFLAGFFVILVGRFLLRPLFGSAGSDRAAHKRSQNKKE